jgi:hypothetical protein
MPKPDNPDNVEKRHQLQEMLKELLENEATTQWECGFLRNLLEQKKLSPKQQACLNRISARLMGGVK